MNVTRTEVFSAQGLDNHLVLTADEEGLLVEIYSGLTWKPTATIELPAYQVTKMYEFLFQKHENNEEKSEPAAVDHFAKIYNGLIDKTPLRGTEAQQTALRIWEYNHY